MPIANLFYPEDIASWWRDRFRTDLKAELGLKDIKTGNLRDFPAPKDLTTVCPSVFVSPADFTTKLTTVNGGVYSVEYHIRVVYVGRIPEVAAGAGPTIESERSKIRRFADCICLNHRMDAAPALALTNFQSYFATPSMVPLRPEEDSLVAQVNAQVVAVALDLLVQGIVVVP